MWFTWNLVTGDEHGEPCEDDEEGRGEVRSQDVVGHLPGQGQLQDDLGVGSLRHKYHIDDDRYSDSIFQDDLLCSPS